MWPARGLSTCAHGRQQAWTRWRWEGARRPAQTERSINETVMQLCSEGGYHAKPFEGDNAVLQEASIPKDFGILLLLLLDRLRNSSSYRTRLGSQRSRCCTASASGRSSRRPRTGRVLSSIRASDGGSNSVWWREIRDLAMGRGGHRRPGGKASLPKSCFV